MTQARDLVVALITEVFHGNSAAERLAERLSQAAERGAELALLPELPLNPWSPCGRRSRSEDAEPPEGPRHQALSQAARRAAIGVVGGAIVKDPQSGLRFNTALTFDAQGRLAHAFQKMHLPEEEGFWETSHYDPGRLPLSVIREFSMPVGIQICSDINRPQGSQILAARGAEAILAPRATEAATYPRWEVVFRANAITCSTYVVSVNRPGPEAGVAIGGPSVVVAPDGEVQLKTTDPLAIAVLERSRIPQARRAYPGYLPIRSADYAREWGRVGEE